MRAVDISSLKERDWIDFSGMSTFARCPRQYYWNYIQHLQADKTALINGSAYHEAKARYYIERKNGLPHEFAKELALAELPPIMALITKEDPKRNLSVAHATMSNYMDLWEHDQCKTIEVEVPFAMELGEALIVGKIDRVGAGAWGTVIEETKTTTIVGTRWPRRAKPNMQIDTYVTAHYVLTGEMPFGGVLDIIPVTDKVGKKGTEPFRIPCPRTEADVESYIEDVQIWWATKKMYKENELWPKNPEVCVPLLGFECSYSLLCSMYPSVKGLESIELPEHYKKEEWFPFPELRED